MNRTRNMFYHDTEESRELFLFTVNESIFYSQICAIVRNLNGKYRKGRYNPDNAIDAFYHVTNNASRLYTKWFASMDNGTPNCFSVTDRFSAAVMVRDYFAENIVKGDM